MIPQSPVTHNDFSAWWSLTWSAELTQWLAGQGSLQTITYTSKTAKCALLELWRSIQYLVYWWKWGMLSQFPLRQEAWHQIQHIHSHGYEPPLPFEKNRISQIQECDECFIIPYNYCTPFPTVLLIFSCYNCQPNSVSLSEHLSWYPLKYLLYGFCTWLTSYRYGHFPWLCYITKGYPLIVAQW